MNIPLEPEIGSLKNQLSCTESFWCSMEKDDNSNLEF